jgi:hypothetical protein
MLILCQFLIVKIPEESFVICENWNREAATAVYRLRTCKQLKQWLRHEGDHAVCVKMQLS